MAYKLNHMHFKSPDPKKTVQWYVDNLGAKVVSEAHRDGVDSYRLDILGIPANVTTISAAQDQKRQHHGLEHIAVDSTSFDADYAKLKASGARVLEERTQGRRIAWFEAPEGMQVELLEVQA